LFSASVIVSTYNRLFALKLALEGFRRQTCKNFEVIIADDGSTDETKNFLRDNKDSYPFRLKHVWQEDNGYRKARILNIAIANAESKLIIFNDGDCIPHNEFVGAHIDLIEKGNFLISRMVLLSEKISNKIDIDYVSRGKLDSFNLNIFLDYVFGDTKYFEYSLSIKNDFLYELIKKYRKNKSVFGSNFSAFKDDLIKINGFNEDFTKWGSEDGELGIRLLNLGLKPKIAICRAINFHYYHKRGYVMRTAENVQRATLAREQKIIRCKNGVDQHLL